MNVRLLAPAAAELHEAVAWHAEQAPGLERRFIEEMRTPRKRIAERPYAWHPLGSGVRRFRLARFPYGLSTPEPRTGRRQRLKHELIKIGAKVVGHAQSRVPDGRG